MTIIKPFLQEFVAWLETAYGNAERGTASEFAVELPPESLTLAEVALEAAVSGERPVLLASTVPMKSIIAALVLRRAGVKLEHVLQGNLGDDQFVALADALRVVKTSNLLIESPVE
jgi:hypothetical protein